MKAIRVHEFGGPEVLKLEEVPTPKPSAGQVLGAFTRRALIPMKPTCGRAPIH